MRYNLHSLSVSVSLYGYLSTFDSLCLSVSVSASLFPCRSLCLTLSVYISLSLSLPSSLSVSPSNVLSWAGLPSTACLTCSPWWCQLAGTTLRSLTYRQSSSWRSLYPTRSEYPRRFLLSSSTTRLSRGRVLRLTSRYFTYCHTEIERGDHDHGYSVTKTPTQPEGGGRRESNP